MKAARWHPTAPPKFSKQSGLYFGPQPLDGIARKLTGWRKSLFW
jgi:hypothetical protein